MIRPVVLVLLTLSNAYTLQEGVTPVQKVVQLLDEMLSTGKKEKEEETKRFTVFEQFCEDTSEAKQRSINEADNQIDQLKADIQKAESDSAQLAKSIAELEAEISGWEADKAAATAERDSARADYDTTHTDYSESVDAIERAIVVLKQQGHDRAQASSLLQKVASLAHIPEGSKRVIASFLATGSDYEPPEVAAYEFQSGGVVDLLEKLKDKFSEERTTLEKEEAQSRHGYEMMMLDLNNNIDYTKRQSATKASTKASKDEASAAAKGELAETSAMRKEDQKYLDMLTSQWKQKTADYNERQKLRQEEMDAVTKAIEILSSNSVAGHASTYLPSLVQKSLSQFLSQNGQDAMQHSVAEFLKGRAQKLESRILAQVASRVEEDPFVKVRQMIQGLIVRLQQEAGEEAQHKAWCDKELKTNKLTREEKQERVNTLQATFDKLTADVAQLTQENADLTAAIGELDAAVAKATDVRNKEKATNEQTVQDAKEAQDAVSRALVVLKEFYSKAAKATALTQQPEVDAPATFDEPYKGMQGENGGVVGMLEVISSDFARLEADTQASEAEAAREYDEFMGVSEADKKEKVQNVKDNEKTIAAKGWELRDTRKDLDGTQGELSAALAYYEKLKPTCLEVNVSYEDRVARREQEIESLKEALRILEGEDM